MQILWIVLGIVALIVLFLGFLPLRLQFAGSVEHTVNVLLRLKVGPFFKIKLLEIKDKELHLDAESIRKRRAEKAAKSQTTVKEEKLPPLAKEDLMALVPEVLGRLRIEKIDIKASLAGNPYYSGLICAVLWSLFGVGLGFLSHWVKTFAAKPNLAFGVDLTKPWSAQADLTVMVRLGNLPRLGFKVLGMVIKNRKKQKSVSNAQAVAA